MMLSESRQSQKDKYRVTHPHRRCPEQANSETESRIEGSQGWWEGRNRELLLNEYRVTVWDDEQVLEMDSGGHCTGL